MTIPFACVAVAFILIYVPRGFVATAQLKEPGGLDNNHPRAQQARLTGLGARAQGAHLNSFESFGPFSAAVIIAHLAQANPVWSAALALGHVVARCLYIALYLGDVAKARSVVWGLSTLATLGLFVIAFIR